MTIGSAPQCLECLHFHPKVLWRMECDAYPEGIPEDIMNFGEKHLTVRADQTGTAVFSKRKDGPYLIDTLLKK